MGQPAVHWRANPLTGGRAVPEGGSPRPDAGGDPVATVRMATNEEGQVVARTEILLAQEARGHINPGLGSISHEFDGRKIGVGTGA